MSLLDENIREEMPEKPTSEKAVLSCEQNEPESVSVPPAVAESVVDRKVDAKGDEVKAIIRRDSKRKAHSTTLQPLAENVVFQDKVNLSKSRNIFYRNRLHFSLLEFFEQHYVTLMKDTHINTYKVYKKYQFLFVARAIRLVHCVCFTRKT